MSSQSNNTIKQDILKQIVSGTKNGRPISVTDKLILFRKLIEVGAVHTLEPLLPILLNLKGEPFTLDNHFVFEPLFRTSLPQELVIKAGRQAGKSISIAAAGILFAVTNRYCNILYITPLFEQAKRLSTQCVRPFLENSPVKSLWMGTMTENSVLQRSFKNQAKIFFSFAFQDSDRVRGLSIDCIFADEIQDIDSDHIPIIKETMSHSNWELSRYTGTPKTEDNFLELTWQRSSMCEWFCHCRACGHWNIPSKDHDLIKMIGKYHDDISENNPATICAKCSVAVNPGWKENRWVPRDRSRINDFLGLHVPQIIMPIHYSKPKKWAKLIAKSQGAGNTTEAQFFNEVLGESFDQSTKLVSLTELKEACVLNWTNKPESLQLLHEKASQYQMRCLAVDWGGGGKKEVSFTTLACLGWRGDGKIDVVWGRRLLTPHAHIAEANECLRVYNAFKCNFLAHDYTGAGALRETFIHHAGVPMNKIIPIAYVRAASKDLMSLHLATRQHPRDFHQLDKTRSLQLVCNCIKLKLIRFFNYDFINPDEAGLLHDFLALIENKVETAQAGDLYTIIRNPTMCDDFAQAVNIGACALFHSTGNWPNIAMTAKMQLTEAQLKAAASPKDLTWDDVEEKRKRR